jgi:cytochrome c
MPNCFKIVCKPTALALSTMLLMTAGTARAQDTPDAAELARARGCMTCHGMVRKAVGPGFAQIAERYRGDKAAASRLQGKIRNGAVGNWGRVIMPRQPKVSEDEARALAAWVLAQRAP